MKKASIALIAVALVVFWALSAAAEEISIVRDPSPIGEEALTSPRVTGDKAPYGGTLRVYIVEPTSRWADDNNRRYEFGMLDFATIESMSIADGGKHYSVAEWTGAQHGYSNITEDNIMIIGVAFNAQSEVHDAYPPNGYWFSAYYGDAAAGALVDEVGYNTSDLGATHTVFIEEGTASW